MINTKTGILIFAQGEVYEKCALVLEKSLKIHNNFPVYIASEFDNDLAADSDWKVENRCMAYDISPFDNTYVFDADTIVLEKLPEIVADLAFIDTPIDHKGNIVLKDIKHRKVFIENNLPNVYTGMYYFTKNENNKKFFEVVKHITKNWDTYINAMDVKPKHLSMDVAFSLALKLTQTKYFNCAQDINFVHGKFFRPQFKLDLYNDVYIDYFKQTGVLHYVDKTLADKFEEWVNAVHTS